MTEPDNNQSIKQEENHPQKFVPNEIERQAQSILTMVQSHRSSVNPLFDKFTESHIDKYLDYIQRDDDNEISLRKTNRWFHLVYFVGTVTAVGLAIYFILPKDKEFLQNIIQILLAFAGGFGAGYGVKSKEK